MKKVIAALCSALLVVVFAFAMTGCSKADKIKKAYENEGYTVSTVTLKDNAAAKTALTTAFSLTDDQVKEAEQWEVIFATKVSLDGGTAFVLKFPSAGKIKEFFTIEKDDGTKDTSVYDGQKEAGHINGDCWLFSALGGAEVIFKNA